MHAPSVCCRDILTIAMSVLHMSPWKICVPPIICYHYRSLMVWFLCTFLMFSFSLPGNFKQFLDTVEPWCFGYQHFLATHFNAGFFFFFNFLWLVLTNWDEITWLFSQLPPLFCCLTDFSETNTCGCPFCCGPGSSLSIPTDYGLDSPGSNPAGDMIFCPSRPALGPTQPPVKW